MFRRILGAAVRSRMVSCLCTFLAPSLALACSGPDAAEEMRHARYLGLVLGLVAVALGAAVLLIRRRGLHTRRCLAACVLALINPGWWFPVDYGDCGEMRISLSIAVIVYCTY